MLPVRYLPEAQAQLAAIEAYIAEQASPAIAERYVGRIVARCALIGVLPRGGRLRRAGPPGLRSVAFRGRVTIFYYVADEAVLIAGVKYGSQDEAKFLDALPR